MHQHETGHGASAMRRYGAPWSAVVRIAMVGAAAVVVVAALWATAVAR